ncbi:MAG: HEAT repeat domain-containing protein [Planctomycetota bacterium]
MRTHPQTHPARVLTLLPTLLPTLLLAACSSTGGGSQNVLDLDREKMAVEVYNSKAMLDQSGIGAYLVALDRSIQQWNQIFLTGNRTRDRRKLKGVAEDIGYRTRKLFPEIVAQLETGPPYNRRVAAAAIGFVQHGEALSPLLSALSDPDAEVRANVLLGLAVLGDSATPLAGIVHELKFGAAESNRSNAALAILEVLRSGGQGDPEVVEAARSGLHDTAPFVRTQSALILAHQLDVVSIEDLRLQLLEDEANSAAMAAARSLAYIGQKDMKVRGQCARALTSALSRVNKQVKVEVLIVLSRLAERRYPDDDDWIEWSHRLPS